MKEISRKEIVKTIFSNNKTHTCLEITNYFIKKEDMGKYVPTNFGGYISGILCELVKEGFLVKSENKPTVYLKIKV